MKEINDYLPYFPPDVTVNTACVTPAIFLDNDLKDILDKNFSQAFKDICRKTQCNMLKHSISDALDYLQNVESSYANSNTARTSQSNLSGRSSKKDKDKGKGSKVQGKLKTWMCNTA